MEDKYIIAEKEYTREELLAFGKAHYPKFYWIFRGVGLFLLFTGVSYAGIYLLIAILLSIYGSDQNIVMTMYSIIYFAMVIPCVVLAVTGIVLFCVSFKKKPDESYIKHSIDYYTKADLNKKAREQRLQRRQEKIAKKEENKDVSQLIKYKELLDAGVISQEEYDAKKKELL